MSSEQDFAADDRVFAHGVGSGPNQKQGCSPAVVIHTDQDRCTVRFFDMARGQMRLAKIAPSRIRRLTDATGPFTADLWDRLAAGR